MPNFTKESIHFLSADGKTQSAAYFYTPNGQKPKAVIQICHGMCEYIGRYEHMIDRLAEAGYAVCGNDHLGHGNTSPGSYGFFAEKDGYLLLLRDMKTMNDLAREKYPGLPYILYGHSMGSFFARWFAEKNPESQDALVVSGTGGPGPAVGFGLGLSRFLAKTHGPKYVSNFMVKCSTGSYCRGIDHAESPSAWLSRDSSVWKAYDADPMCAFRFTVSAYRDMLTAYSHVSSTAWASRLRKDLPVLIYSGDLDPVGAYGKGVRAVYKMLMDAGMEDVTMRLYPGGRHEMHNETNKDEVFDSLIAWCDAHI